MSTYNKLCDGVLFIVTGGTISDSTLLQVSITGSCAYSVINLIKDITTQTPREARSSSLIQKSINTFHKYFSNVLLGTAVSSASLLILRYVISSLVSENNSAIQRKKFSEFLKLRHQFYRDSFMVSLLFSMYLWKMKQKAKNLLWLKQLILSNIHKAFIDEA